MSPPPHIQRAFPKSPMTSWPPGWMEKDRNALRYPAGNGSRGFRTQYSSPRGSKEAPRRNSSGVRVSPRPRALPVHSIYKSKAGKGEGSRRSGDEATGGKRDRRGRVCVCLLGSPQGRRDLAYKLPEPRPGSQACAPHLPHPTCRSSAAPCSASPATLAAPGNWGGPRTPRVHPLRSAVPGGGEARR